MATQAFLEKAYLAYFGRPVDPVGFSAFQGSTDQEVYEAFFASPESQRLYGSEFGESQINAIYNMLFGRSAEQAGLDYWTHQMELGLITPAGAALSILDGSLNEDKVAIQNKLAASTAFTNAMSGDPEMVKAYVGDAAAQFAREWLETVKTFPASAAQVNNVVGEMVDFFGPNVRGEANLFTLTDVMVKEATADIVHAIDPIITRETYWGYNPHIHGELDVNNNAGGNTGNMTNEGPIDGGVPIADLYTFLNTYFLNEKIVGADSLLALINNSLDRIKDITAAGAVDTVQGGGGNAAVGGDGAAGGAGATGDGGAGGSGGSATTGDINAGGDYTGTYDISVTLDDGTIHTAIVELNASQFEFLQNLLFDAEGNTRLFEVERKVWPQVELKDQEGNAILDAAGQKILVNLYEYTAKGITTTTYYPIILTTFDNNGGTVEDGIVTGPSDDLIVAGRLELLHQAYIDAGAGYNILEVDAKGTYAQPLALSNIQEIRVQNMANVYTVPYGSGDGILDNSTYPDLSSSTGVSSNSWLDITRATSIETLVVTQAEPTGPDVNGSGTTVASRDMGELTIIGVRNNATLRLEGDFSRNVTVNYGEGQDGPLNVELLIGDITADINILHNAGVINVDSQGVDNHMHKFFAGGSISRMNVTGTGYFAVEEDMGESFNSSAPAIINASTNTGGIDLTLNDHYKLTVTGTAVSDEITATGGGVTVIDAGNGNNEVNVDGNTDTATVTTGTGNDKITAQNGVTVVITAGDGNNTVDTDNNSKSVTITTGTGNDTITSENGKTVTINAGAGDNTIDTDGSDLVVITTGAGNDTVTSVQSEKVTVNAGDGNNTITVSAEEIAITTGTGNDVITLVGTGNDITGGVGSASTNGLNLMLVLDNSGSLVNAGILDDLQAAVNRMLNDIEASGVSAAAVTILFGDTVTSSAWGTIADARAIVDAMTAPGTATDYAGAINAAMTAYAQTGAIQGGQGAVVFVSDGYPSTNMTVDSTLQATWETFLEANEVISYAVGIGGVTDPAQLQPISYDGVSRTDIAPIITDATNLGNELATLVENGIIGQSGNDALLNIELGAGQNTIYIGEHVEPLLQGLTAMEGSTISGENITVFVNTKADLRAAELDGITRVILDDERYEPAGFPKANDGASVGSNESSYLSDRAILTITDTQFLEIGAEAFSVDGSIFHTHALVKIIVTSSTSLTALGVNDLTGNIDLMLELNDGVTLTMTAQQLHERVAPGGVILADDGRTDTLSGKVVIEGAGSVTNADGSKSTFDPFNNSDATRAGYGDNTYLGGSLSHEDFFNDETGKAINVSVKTKFGGYVRPMDTEGYQFIEVDTSVAGEELISADQDTWINLLSIVGDNDLTLASGVELDLGEDFIVDFSTLAGEVNNFTLKNFQDVQAIRGNYLEGFDATVNVMMMGSSGTPAVIGTLKTGSDPAEYAGLVSSGVNKYVVVDIDDGDTTVFDDESATIYLSNNTHDVEVIALRGNYKATLNVLQAQSGIAFELQGDGKDTMTVTPKSFGPNGSSNVGSLNVVFQQLTEEVMVTMNNQGQALTTRPLHAEDITVDNVKAIVVKVEDGNAIIESVKEGAIGATDLKSISFEAAGTLKVVDALGSGLTSIDASAVTGAFTAALSDMAGAFTLTTGASATITLASGEVAASGTVIDGAGVLNLNVIGSTDLSAATLFGVDKVTVGEVTDSATQSSITLTANQVVAIDEANIVGTKAALQNGNEVLNITSMGAQEIVEANLGAEMVLGTVTMASGTWTLNAATDLAGATLLVPADGVLTLTADQFMALADLDGLSATDKAIINITGLTQAHIDAGFTLADVSNAVGTITLAGDVELDSTTDLNGFAVTLADGQTIALATSTQADGLVVEGGVGTTVKFLFITGTAIDVAGYDVTTLLFPASLVDGTNVDAVLVGLPQAVVKVIYNDVVQLVDQTVTLQAGVTVPGGMAFDHVTLAGTELQDFTLNLSGGNVISGDINLAVSAKDTGLIQTYLDTVVINSTGTAGNIRTGGTDNIITGSITTQGTLPAVDNELLSVTINASQDLVITGGIVFEAEINADEVATLTVTGDADVSIGTLDTSSDEVDGLNVVNSGTGTLSVALNAAVLDAADDLSFTGTGDIVLTVAGTVDLSDDVLTAVTQLTLAQGALVSLTMAQGDAIGAANIVLASGATAAAINLEGLAGEPFAVANYGDGVTVNLMTLAAVPSITLNAATNLTGINGLKVPEGTVLNLTAEQFKQLGSAAGNAGTITGIKADGTTSTSNFTVNVTGLTQADVAAGFDLGGVTAANLTLTLAESVAFTTPGTLPTDWDGFDLNGADVAIGGFTFTLETVALADGLNITGTAGSVLKFTDIAAGAADLINASGFDVAELHMTTQLVAGQNIDLLFEGLAESVTKVIYDDFGYIVGTNQTVVVDASSTVSGNLAFIKQEGGVEILDFTMTLGGGVQLSGNVNLSAADAGVLIPQHLKTVIINSAGTAGNTLNGVTTNVISGSISAAALADVDPITTGNQATEENNLLDVTINASQKLIVSGGIVFNSVTADDSVVANDNTAAVAKLTVTGTSDVTLGTVNNGASTPVSISGVDTTDNDVDGLNVVNNSTGTLNLVLDSTKVDQDVAGGNNDVLSFTGTGDIVLTTFGTDNLNLSDDNLSAVSAIKVIETGLLTLSYAQYTALGNANLTVIDGPDAAAVIGNASLFINGYTGGAFNATALDAHFTAVEITLADQNVTLDAGVDLTNVTKLWVQEGRTLTLTAAQFQQLKDNGAIDGKDTDGDATVEAFNLVITGLTQADVDRDVELVDDFADADDGFSLGSVNTHGGSITVTLGENVVTLGKMDNGVVVSGSESVLKDISTTPVMADFVLATGQTLGLVNSTQADGLMVTGAANSTVIFRFDSTVGGDNSIDATDYNVTMLKALATFVGGQNAETLILGLPSAVIEQYYADTNELGFVTATNRLVVVEAGVLVPDGLIYNDLRTTVEVRNLTLTMLGGSTIEDDLNLSTNNESAALTTRFFDTLTLVSSGASANTITGNISAAALSDADLLLTGAQPSTANNLLKVVISATQDLVIGTYVANVHQSGGNIIFNNVDATDDAAANLTVSTGSTGNVTMHGVNVADAVGGGIDTLNITNNSTGTLTLTGGTEAIAAEGLENLVFIGSGDIVMGSDSAGVGAEGILSTTLSSINAAALTGDLTLAEITMDGEGFSLIAGTGKTTLTVEAETLNADWNGVDNVDGNSDDDLGWVFNMANAGVGSELHLGANTYTAGDLNIQLGANTTLYIDATTDLTLLNSLIISGVKSIVLADEVVLTLTAAQATGLKIIAGTDTDNDGNRGTVNIVNLMSDTAANNRVYDFGDIAQEVAGTIEFAAGVNDVTLDALTDLGFFSVTLAELADTSASLAGQTIRFATEAQATRDVLVTDTGANNDSSTNVVWLFNSITAAGGIDTSGYDEALGRLWFSEDLVTAEGGLVESLFTTLPSTILRVDFTDLTALDILLNSNPISRTLELVNFASLGNLTFSDTGASPEEHIKNLTLELGGSVKVGNIQLDDVIAGPNTDPDSVSFDTLTINSHRALHEDDIMAAEAYLNDNDGINETRDGIDEDSLLDDPENAQPVNNNTLGNIGVGTANVDIDLLNVVLNTGLVSVVGGGFAGSQGADLTLGTITYDSEVAGSTASLVVTGANNVTMKAINTSDTSITKSSIDVSGMSGTLTFTGGSPAAVLGSDEAMTITTGTQTGATIAVTKSTEDNGNESLTVSYLLNGVAGQVVINDAAISFLDATAVADAVATALDAIDGITSENAGASVAVVEEDGNSFAITQVVAAGDAGATPTLAGNVANAAGVGAVMFGTKSDTNGVPYAGIAGSDLSLITITGNGYVNLGVLAQIDGTDDADADNNADGDTTDADEHAFELLGNGNTVATLGAANVDGKVVTPSLAVGSSWYFEDVDLTITEDVKFVTGNTLMLNGVDLTIEGDVNLTTLVDNPATKTVVEGLFFDKTSTITVAEGQSLTLTVEQVLALELAGVDIVGSGTVKVTGDATDDDGIKLGAPLQTVNVDISAVTIVVNDPVEVGDDATKSLELTLTIATGDDTKQVGQNVVGSAFDDIIVLGTGDDTVSGGKGDDTLTGGDGSNTFTVTLGTDTITDLYGDKSSTPAPENDVLVVSAGATVVATVSGGLFVATAGTTNAGTVTINGTATVDNEIDLTLAGGANGFAVNGVLSNNDTLIGSEQDDVLNGGDGLQTADTQIDTLTGNGGDDTFVFDVTQSTPIALLGATTKLGDDIEIWDFNPQNETSATGFDADNDGLQALTVLYRNNETGTSFTINDDATILFTDGDALATRIAAELATRGVAASYSAATSLLTLNGTDGQSVEISSLSPVGGVWESTGGVGDDTPVQVADAVHALDVAQISTVTVGVGGAATATLGDVYSIKVTLAEGSAVEFETPPAAGGQTELQIANALVAGLAGLAGGAFSVTNAGGTSRIITITDLAADNGGLTVETGASGGISGSSASNLAGIAVWTTIHADVVADFFSGDDLIQLGIAAGTVTNYREGATEVSYADAYAEAGVQISGGVIYYLTSIDGSVSGEAATGLLFFDGNADGEVDGVIKLTGITQSNFDETDISL